MIESRCGINCSQCEYKEKMSCRGCIFIERPFWGDSCLLKDCCEKKDYMHCGECSAFPCDLLKQFSYNRDQGDNGERIKRCKKWCFE